MPCPWDSFQKAELQFCEENLCAWIKEPSNTWSNAAYLLIGLVIIRTALSKKRPLIAWIGAVSVLTGIGSAFYHASGIWWAAVADYIGMFLGTGAMTALNVRRWLGWRGTPLYAVFFGTSGALVILMLLLPGTERFMYFLAMPCCAIELRLFLKERARTHYWNYLVAWILAGIGVLFWWLDISGRLCNPQNHFITGHAAWHIATAGAFYFFYRYYLQFASLRTEGR